MAIDSRHRLSDALLRAGRSDPAGMDEVYRLSRGRLLSVCRRITFDRWLAEEILHDVYVTVWRLACRFDPERGSAMSWLTIVARNRSLDCRRRARFPHDPDNLLDRVPDPHPTVETAMIAVQTKALMQATLDGIEPRAQRLIRAAFFGEYTYAELAQREGIPLPTVKSIIRRALMKMRAEMSDA